MTQHTRYTLICAALATTLTMGYSLLSFNRFAPITEGWFTEYAALMHRGAFPYKDFYFFLPPAYLVGFSAFTSVFGAGLIKLRLAGVLLIGILGAGIFSVLDLTFKPWVAASAAFATMVYYQTGNAHISYDFVQVMNVLVVWTIYCLARRSTIEPSLESPWSAEIWTLSGGVLCALAAMTKHSNGSVITIFCVLAAFVSGLFWSPGEACKRATAFCLGCAIVVGGFAIWLAINHATRAFLEQVIFGAISTKGTLSVILFQFAREFFRQQFWQFFCQSLLLAWIPLAWALWVRVHPVREEKYERNLLKCAWVLGYFALAVYLSWEIPAYLEPRIGGQSTHTAFVLISCAVLAPPYVCCCLILSSKEPLRFHSPIIVTALIVIGMIWGNGTSAGLSETGVFVGLAILISLLLSHSGPYRFVSIVTVLALGVQISTWSLLKFSRPYSWWGVTQGDLRQREVSSPLPLLHGLYSDAGTMHVFDSVTKAIQTYSHPGSRILVFPHTPIFYALSDRKIMGKAVVDWFDFLPDSYAEQEAIVLVSNPPELVVWLDMTEIAWTEHERLFRGGHLSAQRSIKRALQHLVITGRMSQVEAIPVQPGFAFLIYRLNPVQTNVAADASISPDHYATTSAIR